VSVGASVGESFEQAAGPNVKKASILRLSSLRCESGVSGRFSGRDDSSNLPKIPIFYY